MLPLSDKTLAAATPAYLAPSMITYIMCGLGQQISHFQKPADDNPPALEGVQPVQGRESLSTLLFVTRREMNHDKYNTNGKVLVSWEEASVNEKDHQPATTLAKLAQKKIASSFAFCL